MSVPRLWRQLVELLSNTYAPFPEEALRLRPGERVQPDAGRAYVVTRGKGMLVRPGPGDHDILLRVLVPGEVIRERGTLHAETTLELLALPPGAV
jgi:hypothetical protein